MLKGKLAGVGNVGLLLIAGVAGAAIARVHARPVHAQEKFSGMTNCITVVPKGWGSFKGGSEYGLAFEDEKGTLRFVLHPTCGSPGSPLDPPPAPIDLEVQRR